MLIIQINVLNNNYGHSSNFNNNGNEIKWINEWIIISILLIVIVVVLVLVLVVLKIILMLILTLSINNNKLGHELKSTDE